MQSGKTPQAKLLSDAPPAPHEDPDDEGRAILAEMTIGTVIDGKYRVDEVLGRGAMGVVVAATHQQLGERVALKFLRYRAKGGASDDFQSRFKREARVSARLKNEHITRVIDVGVWRDKVPYMVMDYLTGTDLRQVIKGGGALPIHMAIDYTVQICDGIAEAHAHGIVHRDLKPSNLFITKRPDGSDLLKILDFGISKWTAGEAEIDELTQTGVVLGSPKYMSPEQLFGSSEVDSRADVWSIGAILYEMLCGRPPFDLPTFTKICAELSTDRPPPSLVERRPEITPEVEAVVMRCFVRTPDKRIQNVAELAGALLEAVGAPFAEAVRNKIQVTLDPRGTGRDPLVSSGGLPLTTGTYNSMSASTGSGVRPPVRSGGPPGSEVTGASPTSISGSLGQPERKRPWALIGLGATAAVGLLVYFVGFSGHGTAPPTAPSAAALPPPPAANTATSATTASTSTAAASATDTPSATASANPTAEPTTRPWHGGWRPPPPHGGSHGSASTATATSTATAPPATATATATQPVATATATPTSTSKPDPLGDRQ